MKKCLTLLLIVVLATIPLMALAEAVPVEVKAIDLTDLCNAIIAFVYCLVAYRLVPWIKERTTTAQQEKIKAAIDTAVFAAEQLFKTQAITNRYSYAVEWLRKRGYNVDPAEIEAAVRRMQTSNVVVNSDVVFNELAKEDNDNA